MSVMGIIHLDYWEAIILNYNIRGNKLTNLGPILQPGSIIKKRYCPSLYSLMNTQKDNTLIFIPLTSLITYILCGSGFKAIKAELINRILKNLNFYFQ